jgi:hypothetical protein
MKTALRRARQRWLGVAALVVTSGATGWAIGQAREAHDPASAHTADWRVDAVAHPSATRGTVASIETFADGNRSVHADSVASEMSCPPADENPTAGNAERLERTLVEGTDNERYDALTQALQTGVELPMELLQQVSLSDPSEEVRLLAFTTYIDAVSDDRAEARAALESGIYNDHSAVRAEALRRLDELERYERMLAEAQSPSARK